MPGTPDGETADGLERRVAELMRPLDTRPAPGELRAPLIRAIARGSIPEPYRALLVHADGMTPTLEAYWKQALDLRLLSVRRDGRVLARHIVLIASETGRPVSFGAIRIDLDRFEEGVRTEIVAGAIPLGAILRDHRVEHTSRLGGLFQIESDALPPSCFELRERHTLYGRHNVLVSRSGEVMAEVVEVLPPMTPHDG